MTDRLVLLFAARAALLLGCGAPQDGGPKDAGVPDGPPCAPGETLLEDGRCQAAGLPLDMPPCAPGEALLDNGTCQKAGVPPDACGDGFMPDGKDGCEAILPKDPCPKGTMAVPGMTQCEEVAFCGHGTWGSIPVEANTQYVDQAYQGGGSDGSAQKPWTKIQEGVDAAADGAIVAVAAGSYGEHVLINQKPVKLWGRCPELVSVVGDGAVNAAVKLTTGSASKSEVHSLSSTGARVGILVIGATDVVLQSVWVHDTGSTGIEVNDTAGPASITVTGSLIEGAHDIGIYVYASDATIERTVVRDTKAGSFDHGQGAAITGGPGGEPTNVTIRRSLFERNHYMGVESSGSGVKTAIEAIVVRDTQPDPKGYGGIGIGSGVHASTTIKQTVVEGSHRFGLDAQGADATVEATVVRDTKADVTGSGVGAMIAYDYPSSTRGTATIRASLIERSLDVGVVVFHSDATIESTLIRDTKPSKEGYGWGVSVEEDQTTGDRANLTMRSSIIENNHMLGMLIGGSDALIESSVVRGTLPSPVNGYGHGIQIDNAIQVGTPSKATIRGSLFEENTELGVVVSGADAVIESTTVRNTRMNDQGFGGRGIEIVDKHAQRSTATIRSCLVDQNVEAGVFISSSDATVESTLVRGTRSNVDAQYGDGIVLTTTDGMDPSFVTLTSNRIEQSQRAGLSNFGGTVTFSGVALVCSAFDIEGEEFLGIPFSFDNQGENVCGCPEARSKCQVVSASLEAPAPIEPIPH